MPRIRDALRLRTERHYLWFVCIVTVVLLLYFGVYRLLLQEETSLFRLNALHSEVAENTRRLAAIEAENERLRAVIAQWRDHRAAMVEERARVELGMIAADEQLIQTPP